MGKLMHSIRLPYRMLTSGALVLTMAIAALLLAGCPPQPHTVTIRLSLVADELTSPVGMAAPPDGSGRIFIVDQIGRIRIVDAGGTLIAEPFLDLGNRMVTLDRRYDERGLLSMVFHPDFQVNGRFFVFYNVPRPDSDPPGSDCRARISEFLVSPADADKADPQSERILLEVPKPQANHNGGQLAFGPEGYLYISLGDGGNANDRGDGHTPATGNGQDTSRQLGKILRYNASEPGVLTIPPGNPFVDVPEILPEVYAYGLRNPWRFSFDMAGANRLFCADVGQNLYEEVNIIVAGGNYGWNLQEGFHCFDPDRPSNPPDECAPTGFRGEPLLDPIIEYPHNGPASLLKGKAVIGGYVYRGTAIPALTGFYLFGDWSRSFAGPDGSFFIAQEATDGTWQPTEAGIHGEPNGRLNRFLLGCGQDAAGEVYLLTSRSTGPSGTSGQVLKIVAADIASQSQ